MFNRHKRGLGGQQTEFEQAGAAYFFVGSVFITMEEPMQESEVVEEQLEDEEV
jgi:hypothetical protein